MKIQAAVLMLMLGVGCGGSETLEEPSDSPKVAMTEKELCGCTTKLFDVTISQLTALHSGCTATNLSSMGDYSSQCIAAASRFCTGQGYQGGIPVVYGPPNVTLNCFDGVVRGPTWAQLAAYDSRCTFSTGFTGGSAYVRGCNEAANRYCKSFNHASGFMQEWDINGAGVTCINKPLGTGYKAAVPFSTWSTYHSSCAGSYASSPSSKACRTAAHSYCINAHGAVSGAVVEWASNNDLVCMN